MTAYAGLAHRYLLRLLRGREAGQGMIEYALIIGVIVLTLVVAYQATPLGSAVSGIFESVAEEAGS